MRHGIKIKACFIFLSWLMIFFHSVIPHHHIEDNLAGNSERTHSCVHPDNTSGLPEKLHNQCEDISTCHISNFLFHQFNQDNLIIQTGKEINLSSFLPTGQIIYGTDRQFNTESYFGSASLRAPPVA